jgi:hypothetical protein
VTNWIKVDLSNETESLNGGRMKLVLAETFGAKLLLVLASTVILASESHGTHKVSRSLRTPNLNGTCLCTEFPYIEQVIVAVTLLYFNREGFDSNLSRDIS